MRLLKSQKDQIYDLIEISGLSPSLFEFSDINSCKKINEITNRLKYKNSKYFFDFETGDNPIYPHFAIYSPGENSFKEEEYPGDWDGQIEFVTNWLKFLKREIDAPDKWERLQSEIGNLNLNVNDDDNKFSASEYEILKTNMNILKTEIIKLEMPPVQIETLNLKLDHLTELALNLNKFDWKSLFIGTIISITIQLSITPENAKALWGLVKGIFNNYFLI